MNHFGEITPRSIKLHSCMTCGKSFTRASYLKTHILIHSGVPEEKQYKCSLCDYSYVRLQSLKEHGIQHGQTSPHNCTQCDYRASRASSLSRHAKIHGEETPYECNQQTSPQRRHTINHNEEIKPRSEELHGCITCGKSFNSDRNLRKHIRRHSEKLYKCTLCDY